MAVHLALGQRVVVAGASLAGVRAAEALRKKGFDGEILLVGDEHHLPYNRPPLSKDLVAQHPNPDTLARHRVIDDVSWRLGVRILASNLLERTVLLDNGDRLSWDGLVIATGLRPRALPLPGPRRGLYRLRTFFDAVTLCRALQAGSRVVVVGGGFIGCELAAAAAQLGLRTDLVAPESAPLETCLGRMVGGEVRRRLSARGVRFHLGTVPVRYEGTEQIEGVTLANGASLVTELVIEAVGSEPNVDWLQNNGIDLTNGVLTDAQMRVAGRGEIVACGDVARFPIVRYDSVPRRLEHWTVAVDSARVAGGNLAAHLKDTLDERTEFTAVPSFWSHLADLKIQSFGQPGLGTADVRILEGELSGEAAVGYFREDDLVGVVLLGLTARYAHYRQAVSGSRLAISNG